MRMGDRGNAAPPPHSPCRRRFPRRGGGAIWTVFRRPRRSCALCDRTDAPLAAPRVGQAPPHPLQGPREGGRSIMSPRSSRPALAAALLLLACSVHAVQVRPGACKQGLGRPARHPPSRHPRGGPGAGRVAGRYMGALGDRFDRGGAQGAGWAAPGGLPPTPPPAPAPAPPSLPAAPPPTSRRPCHSPCPTPVRRCRSSGRARSQR